MNPSLITVSFIIPVYNGAAFIASAYANILSQGLSSIELIFVDNNSTDTSCQLVKALQDKDSRIVLLHEKKQGAAAARNKGVLVSKGEYIHFFDVDDTLYTGAILALKTVLETHKEVMSVYGNTLRSYVPFSETVLPAETSGTLTIYKAPEKGLLWFENKSIMVGPPAFLHRRAVFKTIGMFPEHLLVGEDALFHVMLGLHCIVAHLDRYIYMYYRHEASTVSKSNKANVYNDKVFTYWSQYLKGYLPYYYSQKNLPKGYEIELVKCIYGSMGRMLLKTSTIKARRLLYTKLKQDIKPLKVPFLYHLFLVFILYSHSEWIYKFYVFYILEPTLRFVSLPEKNIYLKNK